MITVEYQNIDERNSLYDLYIGQGLFLIEEQNITEGNFLIFGTKQELVEHQKYEEDIGEDIIGLLGQEVVNLKLENVEKDNIINTLGQELTNIKLQLLLQGGE